MANRATHQAIQRLEGACVEPAVQLGGCSVLACSVKQYSVLWRGYIVRAIKYCIFLLGMMQQQLFMTPVQVTKQEVWMAGVGNVAAMDL